MSFLSNRHFSPSYNNQKSELTIILEMFTNRCRACVKIYENEVTVSINNVISGGPQRIKDVLKKDMGLEMDETFSLPQNICLSCFNQLSSFATFKSILKKSENFLKTTLNNAISEDTLNESLAQLEIEIQAAEERNSRFEDRFLSSYQVDMSIGMSESRKANTLDLGMITTTSIVESETSQAEIQAHITQEESLNIQEITNKVNEPTFKEPTARHSGRIQGRFQTNEPNVSEIFIKVC